MRVGGALAAALVAALLVASVLGGTTRLDKNIYTTLTADNACVRLADDNGEIGCTSADGGTVGAIFLVAKESDIATFASAPESDYVVLMAQSVFAINGTVQKLMEYSKFKGAMIYDDNFQASDVAFSTDFTQPNKENGLPYSNNFAWNAPGTGLHWVNIDRPVFLLAEEDVSTVFECYNSSNLIVNNKHPSHPLCALEMKSFMWAAKDARTCLRRGYCDPLGSLNIWGTMRELNSTDDVVLVTAHTDALAFFHDRSFGANADMSGAVAAIGIAELLGRRANRAVRNVTRNIMFSLFNGESFGYIGSSAMAVDMEAGTFPTADVGLDTSRIAAYVELSQLMAATAGSKEYFAHAFIPSTETGPSTKAQATITRLTQAAAHIGGGDATFSTPSEDELPPASLRSFLYEMDTDTTRYDFGGVVLTDHSAAFVNKYYNSEFDNSENIGVDGTMTASVTRLCDLVKVLSRAVWALAADEDAATVVMAEEEPDCDLIESLLYCITRNVSCDLVQDYIGAFGTPGQPASRYVNVFRQGNSVESGTSFLLRALGLAMADEKNVTDVTDCSFVDQPPAFGLMNFNDGRCVRTAVFGHQAISPAFTASGSLKGDFDARYSTWTESTWDDFSVRMFLIDSKTMDIATLLGGIAFLGGAFLVVYLITIFTEQASPTQSIRLDENEGL